METVPILASSVGLFRVVPSNGTRATCVWRCLQYEVNRRASGVVVYSNRNTITAEHGGDCNSEIRGRDMSVMTACPSG